MNITKKQTQFSIGKSLLIIFATLTPIIVACYFIGELFFWDKPAIANQDEYELQVILEAVQNNPMDARLRLELGWQFTQRQEYEKALVEFENVLKMDEKNLGAKLNIAIVKGELGQLEEAIEMLEDIREEAPAMVDARYVLGQAYEEYEEYELAINEYQFILNANPGIVDYMVKLGDAYRKMGELVEAEQYYIDVLSRMPDHSKALDGLAELNNQTSN